METLMLKIFLTLTRGAKAAAEEAFTDRNALLILRQQIRDAAAAIERSKQALAIAIAHEEAEGKRLNVTVTRIADLEERAAAALAAGSDELACEAAGMIVILEADRDAIRQARASFATEIATLRQAVANASNRLADLERGRRIAEAAEAVRRMKSAGRAPSVEGTAAIADAESTLLRLRERQTEQSSIDAALHSLDRSAAPADIASRLEDAGFGKRTRSAAADVLERLRQRNASAQND
jgi:phage shock protein A